MSYEEAAQELEIDYAKIETADATADRAFRKSPQAYKIIRGTDIADLADAVNKAIENGYSCLGRPFYVTPGLADMSSEPHPWVQAMINQDMIF